MKVDYKVWMIISSIVFLLVIPGMSFAAYDDGPTLDDIVGSLAEEDSDCEWGDLEVPLPGLSDQTICEIIDRECPLQYYVGLIANILMALVVAAGLIMVVGGGYVYMTAGGDASRVQTAKSIIIMALLGVLLALSSYTIVRLINPNMFECDTGSMSSGGDTGGTDGGGTDGSGGGSDDDGTDDGLGDVGTWTETGPEDEGDIVDIEIDDDGNVTIDYNTDTGDVGGGGAESITITDEQSEVEPGDRPNYLFNDAQCVEMGVIAPKNAGDQFQVRLIMKNTGTTTWYNGGPTPHKLGADEDDTTWGITRVSFPSSVRVRPTQDHEFLFNVTAPSVPGNYDMSWQMIEENLEWFGEKCETRVEIVTGIVPALAQCEDQADNDGDGLRDIADPDCHTDGNASNVKSYDRTRLEDNSTVSSSPSPPSLDPDDRLDQLCQEVLAECENGNQFMCTNYDNNCR